MVGTVFSGKFFDRNGVLWPLLIGTIVSVGSLLGMANATTVYQFVLAFGVGLGGATGVLMAPIIGAVSHYFRKAERATPLAIAGTGGCVGGVLFPAMLRKSYKSIGFVWSMRCVALIDLVCLCVCILLVKERKLSEKQKLTLGQKVKLYALKSFDFAALLVDRPYLFNVMGCVFAEGTVIITSSYFSFICVKNGFSESEAYLYVTIINVLAVVGRYLSGVIADKYVGSYNVIIFSLFITGVADLVMWMPFKDNTVALWVYSVFYGFFYGGIFSLIPNCCSQIVKADIFGSRYATMYAVAGFCLLGFMPASSSLIGNGWDNSRNDGFIIFAAGMSFISGSSYLITRTMSVGWTLKKF
ncbi:unnamed protein product [Ambrosiozyma monospora]|uniref:Unnamed protein product n=1 Tax=Ambrosiozyma monospora TaxID=43982 RepID=A0ACB5TBV8_AMBMO|nr:unnamed protein product [Ambrosiozyma monospora]